MAKKFSYKTVSLDRGEGVPENSPCFSCSYKDCPVMAKCTATWSQEKDRKFITKCSGYVEQIFGMDNKHWTDIRSLIIAFCYDKVSGQENITQSNDGFDHMMDGLMFGLAEVLTRRSLFNWLEDLGHKAIAKKREARLAREQARKKKDGRIEGGLYI